MLVRTIAVGPLQANCYVIGQDRAIVVDPGDQPQRIIELIDNHGINVAGVLLTHSHFDHISALNELVNRTGAPVYIHHLDAEGLGDNYLNLSAPYGRPLQPSTADVLVQDGETIPCDGQELRILHTPGHTPGSICAYWEDESGGHLISGDTLFENSWGRTDFPGGDVTEMQRSLDRLRTEIPRGTRVMPGHGKTFIKG